VRAAAQILGVIGEPGAGELVVALPGDGPGHWAGGPSALWSDGSFWLAYRLRRPVDRGRGFANVVARSSDGVRFETVATVTSEQFGSASLERPALVRTDDGGWRLYVSCSTRGSKHWWVEALDARSDRTCRRVASGGPAAVTRPQRGRTWWFGTRQVAGRCGRVGIPLTGRRRGRSHDVVVRGERRRSGMGHGVRCAEPDSRDLGRVVRASRASSSSTAGVPRSTTAARAPRRIGPSGAGLRCAMRRTPLSRLRDRRELA